MMITNTRIVSVDDAELVAVVRVQELRSQGLTAKQIRDVVRYEHGYGGAAIALMICASEAEISAARDRFLNPPPPPRHACVLCGKKRPGSEMQYVGHDEVMYGVHPGPLGWRCGGCEDEDAEMGDWE